MAGALLLLEARAHLGELLTRPAALPVPAPVDLLEFVQELGRALGVSGNTASFHVGDAFPGLSVFREVVLVRALGLDQIAFTAVRAKARVDREDYPVAGVGAD